MTTYQRLVYNSLMWYTGLPLMHRLPNTRVVWTNGRTCSLALRSQSLSYVSCHWCRQQLGLASYAVEEVLCITFTFTSHERVVPKPLISGHVFEENLYNMYIIFIFIFIIFLLFKTCLQLKHHIWRKFRTQAKIHNYKCIGSSSDDIVNSWTCFKSCTKSGIKW